VGETVNSGEEDKSNGCILLLTPLKSLPPTLTLNLLPLLHTPHFDHQPPLDLLTPLHDSVRDDNDDDDDDNISVQLLLLLFFKVLLSELELPVVVVAAVGTSMTWHGCRTLRFNGTVRLRLLPPFVAAALAM